MFDPKNGKLEHAVPGIVNDEIRKRNIKNAIETLKDNAVELHLVFEIKNGNNNVSKVMFTDKEKDNILQYYKTNFGKKFSAMGFWQANVINEGLIHIVDYFCKEDPQFKLKKDNIDKQIKTEKDAYEQIKVENDVDKSLNAILLTINSSYNKKEFDKLRDNIKKTITSNIDKINDLNKVIEISIRESFKIKKSTFGSKETLNIDPNPQILKDLQGYSKGNFNKSLHAREAIDNELYNKINSLKDKNGKPLNYNKKEFDKLRENIKKTITSNIDKINDVDKVIESSIRESFKIKKSTFWSKETLNINSNPQILKNVANKINKKTNDEINKINKAIRKYSVQNDTSTFSHVNTSQKPKRDKSI